MVRESVRSMLAEPRVPDPPPRAWGDWALVAVLAPIAVIEAATSQDVVWPLVSAVVTLAVLPTLLWRRTHPLASLVVAFAAITAVDLVSLAVGEEWEGLGTNVFVLLLLYSLFRWDSGRNAAIGLALTCIPLLLSIDDQQRHDGTEAFPASNLLLGGMVLLVAAALGASVRYQDKARVRGLDQMKLLEREQLARELHDTVAHHVSAIAIRAQAGRVVAPSDPEAALDALRVIEEEASRTLTEMRALVGALRESTEADLTPQRGVADIDRLAGEGHDRPEVAVERTGDLDRLRPTVDAALYRLAQESITNARRHARHATRVRVLIRGDADVVRLTVVDDGDASAFDPRTASGFGLVGMAERAKLLGGTFEAGPNRSRGWTVDVALPRGSRGS